MGQILHKNAKTTERNRKEIQTSKESASVLAARYGISKNTVYKWKHRAVISDKASGHTPGTSGALSPMEQQIVCEARRTTLLPLDELLESLQPLIPKLTRSNLHRCLKRHGLSVLPIQPCAKKKRKVFKTYKPGYFHIDTSEIRLGRERWVLYVAIDRTTKYAYIELHEDKKAATAAVFLEHLALNCPYKIHIILTDNGAEFTYELMPQRMRPKNKIHLFDQICAQIGAEHRNTPFRSPWTNGQVEVMNRKVKDATTKTYHYDHVDQLKEHLYHWLLDYNFNRKLTALNRKTPWEYICTYYAEESIVFTKNPNKMWVGRNT
jgi:transposase InsO family protein/transposase-like protein